MEVLKWFIVISIAVSVLALLYVVVLAIKMFVGAWQRNRELARNGVDVEAEVIGREIKPSLKGASLYFITYRFQTRLVEGKREVIATEQVWFMEYDKYPIGTKLKVRYLRSDPNNVLRSQKVVGKE